MIRNVFVIIFCAIGSIYIVSDLIQITDPKHINFTGYITEIITLGLLPMLIGITLSKKPFETACWFFCIVVGALIIFGEPYFWEAALENYIKVAGIIAAAVFLILCIYLIRQYNSMMQLDEETKKSWGDVQVAYQKRLDMINALMQAVRKYLTHEKEIIEKITNSRNRYQSSQSVDERIKSIDSFEESFAKILLSAGKNVDIKSDRTITHLMAEISNNEENVANRRDNYNGSLKSYNKVIRSFPIILVSKLYGFHSRKYFEAELAAASKVNF